MGMKAPQATLLPNKEKKKDKEDYTTSVAKMCRETDVVQSSSSFFFAMFVSGVAQGAFIPILFPYFLQVLPYTTLIFTKKFFTPSMLSKNVPCNRCSVVFLVFLFLLVRQQGNLGYFDSHLVSILFTGPSSHDFSFYQKKLPLISLLFCVLQAQNL